MTTPPQIVRRLVGLLGLAGLAGLVMLSGPTACTDVAGGGGSSRCEINSDCPLPEVCIEERCVIQCRIDADCPAGEQCEENICVDPLAGCLSDADCISFGLVCDVVQRRCVAALSDMRVAVRDASPMDRGQPADDARVSPPRDAMPPPPRDAVPPRDAAPPPPRDAAPPPRDAAPPPRDAAPPPIDAAPPVRGDGRYGDPCRCAADCQSGFCLQNPYNDFAGQCSQRCGAGVADPGCPDIDRCVQARVPPLTPGCPDPGLDIEEGDIVEVCAPNETGIPCRGAADCIIDGVCITPPDPLAGGGGVTVQPVCGARCAGDQGCPVGFNCQAVPTQGGGQVDVCAAATEVAACPDGLDASCDAFCAAPGLGRCIGIDQAFGYCGCACRNGGDCPLGFACSRDVLDTGDPVRPGICLPIAGYNCPQGDNSCLSLLCAPPQGNDPFDRCTAPCNGPQDCPQGYNCIQPQGAQITVCVVQ